MWLENNKKRAHEKFSYTRSGTAGTMMPNHLHHELKKPDWQITIIEERNELSLSASYLFFP